MREILTNRKWWKKEIKFSYNAGMMVALLHYLLRWNETREIVHLLKMEEGIWLTLIVMLTFTFIYVSIMAMFCLIIRLVFTIVGIYVGNKTGNGNMIVKNENPDIWPPDEDDSEEKDDSQ